MSGTAKQKNDEVGCQMPQMCVCVKRSIEILKEKRELLAYNQT